MLKNICRKIHLLKQLFCRSGHILHRGEITKKLSKELQSTVKVTETAQCRIIYLIAHTTKTHTFKKKKIRTL